MPSARAGLTGLSAAVALLVVALADVAAAGGHHKACKGGFMNNTLNIEGVSHDSYLAGSGFSSEGGRLTVKHNAGMSVFSACEEEWAPESIAQFKLLGRTLSFTVDLSNVGCACNLAFYLISMPALDMQGKFHRGSDRGGQPPYYCDANQVGGQWCPEVDIMEANNHAFQSTAHKCDAPSNGHYTYCDRSGCAQNTNDKHGSYGPGHRYTIDTRKPFEVHTQFPEDDGVLVGMRTVLRQGGKKVVLQHADCDPDYLAALSGAMKDGMSLRITYWGGEAETMSWMDSPPCDSQTCSGHNAGHAVLSNVVVSPKHDLKHYLHDGWKEPQESDQSNWQQQPAGWSWSAPPTTAQPTWTAWSAPPTAEPLAPRATASPAAGAAVTTISAPPPAAWLRPPKDEVTEWVPDSSAPWECHQYSGDQQKTMWCARAEIWEGFEYSYNAGQNSPCGGCWCCKRKAKPEAVPASAQDSSDDLVWVVSDRHDKLFGHEVPREVTADTERFAKLHDHGIIEWKNGRHFVKHMPRGQLPKKAKEPCAAGSDSPCDASVDEEASAFGVFLQKFSRASPLATGAPRAEWALGVGATAAGALFLGAVALATKRIRASRVASAANSRAPAAGGAERKLEAASSERGAPQSPQRPHAGPGPSGLRRAGSSCQRLLSMQEMAA